MYGAGHGLGFICHTYTAVTDYIYFTLVFSITELSLEGVLGGKYFSTLVIWGVRKEDRKRNIQSITISPLRFENLTKSL